MGFYKEMTVNDKNVCAGFWNVDLSTSFLVTEFIRASPEQSNIKYVKDLSANLRDNSFWGIFMGKLCI